MYMWLNYCNVLGYLIIGLMYGGKIYGIYNYLLGNYNKYILLIGIIKSLLILTILIRPTILSLASDLNFFLMTVLYTSINTFSLCYKNKIHRNNICFKSTESTGKTHLIPLKFLLIIAVDFSIYLV
jgi:hypothetical protein